LGYFILVPTRFLVFFVAFFAGFFFAGIGSSFRA